MDYLKSKTILTYDDVVPYAAGDSAEALVDVRTYDPFIISEYAKFDMLPYVGDSIFVRDTVARRLATASFALAEAGYRVKVVYGYRHPEVQGRYFARRRAELALERPELDAVALDRYTHNFVAVPDVAGHPAGAALDLTLVGQDGSEVDMGTGIADYADPQRIQTYATGLAPAQGAARAMLHDAMVAAGFAPFYGEWWHFSYGDREWAAFYGRDRALYGAMDAAIGA